MIKVLHSIYAARFGGIENLVLDLMNEQTGYKELEVHLLILNPKGEFLDKMMNSGLSVHTGNISGGWDLSPSKYYNLWKLFRRFDLLHFHNFNTLVALTALLSGTKIVYTEHGNFASGRRVGFSDRVNFFLRRIFLNHCVEGVTFNSYFTERYSYELLRVKPKQRKVIYNGVAEKKLTGTRVRTELGISPGCLLVGTTSRLAGVKCIQRLINGYAKFQINSPDSRLLIVGDGPERQTLEQLASDLNISNKVIFTGYKANVQDYQEAMDICIFPSRNEAFGLVVVECLQRGKPVFVWFDGGGMTEIIGAKYEANIIKDEEDLAEKLLKFDPKQEAALQGERKEYAEVFTIHKMARAFLDFYKRL